MPGGHTSMGGERGQFPSTRWSMILGARADNEKALDELCRGYWKPVYAYIRAARAHDNEQAKDLTQQFFAMILGGAFLDRYAPDKGSFRNYLRGSVHRFLLNQYRDATTLKKGGDRKFIPIDAAPEMFADDKDTTPEEAFDRQWANAVLDHAVDDLREELKKKDREVVFRVFDRFELSATPDDSPTYRKLAEEFGIKESDVSNHLMFCKRRLRELIVGRIRDTVNTEEEARSEFVRLFEL